VSIADPGGDAHDPHFAALSRELEQEWGLRNDKDDQLYLPLPDAAHWKRVRYWGVQHFTGFRYGDEHHVITIALLQDVGQDAPHNSKLCMRRFEAWARPQVSGYDVKLGPFGRKASEWKGQHIDIHYVDGHFDSGFSRTHFSAAWAAYAAYPDACLIYAMAVPWGEHGELAKKVRDRFVEEAFERVEPRTEQRPYRK
jgi:hypothetical protein